MPDNVTITDATDVAVPVAADLISGIQHQRVKVEFGADGTATDVSSAAPMPTTDAAVLAKLTADPATQTTLAAVLAKIIAAPATEATLASILTELGQKLEAGGEVALDSATLAALESITVSGTVTSLPPASSPVSYEQIAVAAAGGSSVGLTPPGSADFAVVIPSVAVRWRDDATDPTAAVGMPIAAGVPVTFDTALGVVEFIAQGASTGVLDVAYYAV